MEKCQQCGRLTNRIHHVHGYDLCSKHMHQLYQYGKFLDDIPRTQNDPNEYYINEGIVYVKLYDLQSRETGIEFFFDETDIDILKKYRKWRLSYNYPKTGSGKNQFTLGQLLLKPKEGEIVEHINGNTLDNTRKNLRLCSQAKNTYNKHSSVRNKSGFIGVCWDKKREKWTAEIRKDNKKKFLGYYEDVNEAGFARFLGEIAWFKEYRNTNDDNWKIPLFNEKLSINAKQRIKDYVERRLDYHF